MRLERKGKGGDKESRETTRKARTRATAEATRERWQLMHTAPNHHRLPPTHDHPKPTHFIGGVRVHGSAAKQAGKKYTQYRGPTKPSCALLLVAQAALTHNRHHVQRRPATRTHTFLPPAPALSTPRSALMSAASEPVDPGDRYTAAFSPNVGPRPERPSASHHTEPHHITSHHITSNPIQSKRHARGSAQQDWKTSKITCTDLGRELSTDQSHLRRRAKMRMM